ncbi:MAG: cbb3-type cytochrome c oxidase N-terminal domain-containing protein [Bacteroidota bacterium]|nr:cbb3-type cytochrome c oxidase N-terminal domain-containing protein [Bacteroidota bacterium]
MSTKHPKDEVFEHTFDGIQEYDNDLPGWWKKLFYGTIIFAVLYLLHFHVLGTGDLQRTEYMKEIDPNYTEPMVEVSGGVFNRYTSPFLAKEENLTPRVRAELDRVLNAPFDEHMYRAMSKATPEQLEKLKVIFPDLHANYESGEMMQREPPTAGSSSAIPSSLTDPLTDAGLIADGKNTFETHCVSCHGANGGGGIGPNLTDEYWIHGNSMQDVLRVVYKGVPAKGMIAWEKTLSQEQIENVSSYVLVKLAGSDVPNGKAPQGEKVE